jgi:hypothetical protein
MVTHVIDFLPTLGSAFSCLVYNFFCGGSSVAYGSGSSISSESGSGYGSRVLMTKNLKKYSLIFF